MISYFRPWEEALMQAAVVVQKEVVSLYCRHHAPPVSTLTEDEQRQLAALENVIVQSRRALLNSFRATVEYEDKKLRGAQS